MKIATFASSNTNTAEILQQLIEQLETELGAKPDFLAIYYSELHDSETVSQHVSNFAGEQAVHGSTSCLGVMTQTGFHAKDGYGMGIFGISDPDGDYGTGACAIEDDARKAASDAMKQALANSGHPGEMPAMIWLNAAPGEEEAVLIGIQDVVGADVPIAGGSAADNTVSGNWNQIANGKVFQNAVVVSAFFPSVDVSYSFHSGYDPTEITGKVTRAKGRIVYEIDGKPAAEVYNQWCNGKIADALPEGGNVLALTTLNPLGRIVGEANGIPYYKLSHPDGVTAEKGLSMFSIIEEGDELVMMTGTTDSLISRAGRTATYAMRVGAMNQDSISGSLMIYCAGCMLTVQQQMEEVATGVNTAFGGKPFIGVFTFGEQGCLMGNENTHGNLMISVVTFGV